LDNLAPSKSLVQQHLIALHSKNSKDLIMNYNQMQNLLPKNILKRSLEHYLNSPEEIIYTKINFLRNFSALSIALYLLGIGDRHLDNYLINTKTCQIYAIDFGFSFGLAYTNIIPELVPFRLTPQIRNVIYPFGIKGIIRQNMIDVFSAFKNAKHKILDYCDVFVKEPLLDWTKSNNFKNMKKFEEKNNNKLNININNAKENVNFNYENENRFDKDNYEDNLHEKNNKWIPLQKLKIINNKLSNYNPIFINMEEFKETIHNNEVIIFSLFFL